MKKIKIRLEWALFKIQQKWCAVTGHDICCHIDMVAPFVKNKVAKNSLWQNDYCSRCGKTLSDINREGSFESLH